MTTSGKFGKSTSGMITQVQSNVFTLGASECSENECVYARYPIFFSKKPPEKVNQTMQVPYVFVGLDPSWYVQHVVVWDSQTEHMFFFVLEDWLSVDNHNNSTVEKEVLASCKLLHVAFKQ